jgi:ferric-dicitrate binding protein FerR (iron transport regulator)
VSEKVKTVSELKEDPSFRRMALGMASAEEVEQWNRWIELSDENRQKANEAITGLIGFEFKISAEPDLDREWRRLQTAIAGKVNNPDNRKRKRENKLKWIFRAVAVLLLISSAGAAAFLFNSDAQTSPQLEMLAEERMITTDADQHKTLQFSNGSKVILNSHSTLTYRTGTPGSSTIEVILDGEAWFEADPDHEQAQPAFAVTTPDGVIRDIGTKFLVTVENGLSRIVLQEGVVEVEPAGREDINSSSVGYSFKVKKGEMVEFRETEIITRKTVNPTFYSSWATGVLVLAQSGVKEFAEYVEERFDVQVQLSQSSLEDIRLNGTVYYRSLDELVRSVSEVIGIPVYRSADRDTVYIGM